MEEQHLDIALDLLFHVLSMNISLEAIDGVESAEVSHEADTAVVSMSAAVDDAVLKEAVEAKDYKVLGIE